MIRSDQNSLIFNSFPINFYRVLYDPLKLNLLLKILKLKTFQRKGSSEKSQMKVLQPEKSIVKVLQTGKSIETASKKLA